MGLACDCVVVTTYRIVDGVDIPVPVGDYPKLNKVRLADYIVTNQIL